MGCTSAKKSNASKELTLKQIAFLEQKTKFNEKEIREWHAGFLRDCPNGKLDRKRFVDVYKQFYPQGKADAFCKYAFATFDSNNDGTIDFVEFLLAINATSQNNLDDRLALAFEMYDVSGDGQIDQKELSNVIAAMYDLVGETDRKGDRDPKKRAAEIIAKLDVNGDKKLSKEEFIAGCKSDPVIRYNLNEIFIKSDQLKKLSEYEMNFIIKKNQENQQLKFDIRSIKQQIINMMTKNNRQIDEYSLINEKIHLYIQLNNINTQREQQYSFHIDRFSCQIVNLQQ